MSVDHNLPNNANALQGEKHMKRIWKQVSRYGKCFTERIVRLTRHSDDRNLSRHILKINQMHDLNDILKETAHCLKTILNYRIFAFAVQEDEQLELWVDPAFYSRPMQTFIMRDFDSSESCEMNVIDHMTDRESPVITFQPENIRSYVLLDGRYHARLYLLPRGTISRHHSDIIDIIIKSLGISLKNHMDIKRLKNDAAFDPLTNCYNRREFNRLIDHQIAHSHRHGKPLSLLMLDIDHFKRVNDIHGHPAGDKVLKAIVALINDRIRKGDYLVRYGGEEFVIVLPETRLKNALELAEQLRERIATTPVQIGNETELTVTASFGVSGLNRSTTANRHHLLKKADERLYRAKNSGRNQVMPAALGALKPHKRETGAGQQGNLISFDHLAQAGS